jgi:hypothetical protein
LEFLYNLKYSYKETFDWGYDNVCFRLFHGLPRMDQSLDEQMIADFDDYKKILGYSFRSHEPLWLAREQAE